MFVDVIVRCKIYFVFLIFVVRASHENILTTKISRSTVRINKAFLQLLSDLCFKLV